MKRYGLVKLEEEDEIYILCTWNENIFNRIVNDATNTLCIKPVRDLVTNEYIKQDPFVFWDEFKKIRKPKCLTYVTYPKSLTREQAKEYLEKLKENPEELHKYVDYINDKKAAAANVKKGVSR